MNMSPRPITILMAEDDPEDQMLTRDALGEAKLVNELRCVSNGEELLAYLRHEGEYGDTEKHPRPGIILLDLNMPKMDGREALSALKEDPELKQIPVVVLTTSRSDEDVYKSYDLGVSGYINKPVSFEGLVNVIQTLGKYWFEIVELPPPHA